MKNIKKIVLNTIIKLKQKEFLKNAAMLTIGTVAAQVIILAFYPILTRLYSPAEFGVMSMIYMLTALFTIIMSGSAENAILISKTRKVVVIILAWIVLRSIFVICAIMALVYLIIYFDKTNWVDGEIKNWLPMIPLLSFLVVIYTCFSEWALREKKFKILVYFKLSQSVIVSIIKVISGLLRLPINGLILGELLGKLIIAIIGVKYLIAAERKYLNFINLSRINIIRKKYYAFPKYMMPDQLINSLGGSMHIPFFLMAFGSSQLGIVSITMSILYLPVSVISSAIKDVFRQRAVSEIKIYGSCKKLYIKVLTPVAVGGLLGFGALYLVAPWLFKIILGDNWSMVGDYVRILMPMFYLNFVSMSMGGVLVVSQRLGISLSWQVSGLTLTAIALIIGSLVYQSVIITLYLFMISKCITYTLHMMLSFYYSDKPIT